MLNKFKNICNTQVRKVDLHTLRCRVDEVMQTNSEPDIADTVLGGRFQEKRLRSMKPKMQFQKPNRDPEIFSAERSFSMQVLRNTYVRIRSH